MNPEDKVKNDLNTLVSQNHYNNLLGGNLYITVQPNTNPYVDPNYLNGLNNFQGVFNNHAHSKPLQVSQGNNGNVYSWILNNPSENFGQVNYNNIYYSLIINGNQSKVFGYYMTELIDISGKKEFRYSSKTMLDDLQNYKDEKVIQKYVISAYELYLSFSNDNKKLAESFRDNKSSEDISTYRFVKDEELIFDVGFKNHKYVVTRYDFDGSISWKKEFQKIEDIMETLTYIPEIKSKDLFEISLQLEELQPKIIAEVEKKWYH